jgi:primosomal protein N' (replication factor Y) (superfamily II helicase)
VSGVDTGEQLELLRAATRGRKPRPPDPVAERLPVARVAVDVPLPHLDRVFDYAVPAPMAEDAQPGVRVRVRFAGQDVEGFLLERVPESDHEGRLSPLRRVVSAERVLTPEVLRLCRAVADAYAGNLTDVLRLAVPARHARTEQETPKVLESLLSTAASSEWSRYPAGAALLKHLAAGDSPRAVWSALAGPGWTSALVEAVVATRESGRGALVVLPDKRDVDVLEQDLVARLGPGGHARLEADLGPTARYRNFLAALRGDVQVVVGTRAAAFAPVRDLGLVAIWDDGDDLHQEPRAPYPHVREVLRLRAGLEDAALLAGSWSRSVECAAWVRSGFAAAVEAGRPVRRRVWPGISVASSGPGAEDDPSAAGRLPATAWRALRDGLDRGPVLVQVPRAGYVPGLACQTCRRPARCAHCHGPLAFPDGAAAAPIASCRWCGRPATDWACPHCRARRLRATSVGVMRTAEELGRAFAGATVVVPRPDAGRPAVPPRGLVVATPGLEPPVPGGYAAAVLLDGWRMVERGDLRAGEDALRRWLTAAALVRGREAGGVVVACVDPELPVVQALVRVDPGGHADRELSERAELGFPPAVVMAGLTGSAAAVQGLTELVEQPPGTEVLGPTPLGERPGREADEVQMLLRAPREEALALARAVHAAAAVRSARRDPGAVRVQIDPPDLG